MWISPSGGGEEKKKQTRKIKDVPLESDRGRRCANTRPTPNDAFILCVTEEDVSGTNMQREFQI